MFKTRRAVAALLLVTAWVCLLVPGFCLSEAPMVIDASTGIAAPTEHSAPTQPEGEDGCFCCCRHVVAAFHFDPSVALVVQRKAIWSDEFRPEIYLPTLYHPPRS